MRPAAYAPPRRSGRTTAEFARGIRVAKKGAQHALAHHLVGPRGQALAVERARPGRAGCKRIVDHRHQRRGHGRALARGQVGTLAPHGSSRDHARQLSQERARRFGSEHGRYLTGGNLARSQLGKGPPGRLQSDCLSLKQPRSEARSRPVATVAFLAVGVVAHGRHDQQEAGAPIATRETG